MPEFLSILKKQLIHFGLFLLKPYMLAFYVWIAVILFSPHYFQKYKAEIIESQKGNFDYQIYYHDLNNDGISEKIISLINKGAETPAITYYYEDDKIINQWNLRGNWLLGQKLFFGDYNNNGYAEVYCITSVGDSLFLNIKELLLENGVDIQDRFICKTMFYDVNRADPSIIDARVMQVGRDNYKEFVFILNSGFSLQPRNVFAYDIAGNSLTVSPKSADGISNFTNFLDINGDGIDEITGGVAAVNNIHYDMPYTDSSSWLMVFNPKDSLNFLFPPIEYKGLFGGISPYFVEAGGQKYIASIYKCNSDTYSSNGLILQLFSTKGKLLKERLLPSEDYATLLIVKALVENDDKFYLMDLLGSVYSSDTSLNIKKFSNPDAGNLHIFFNSTTVLDADGDGEEEVLMISQRPSPDKLVLYRSSLKESTVIDLPDSDLALNIHFTIKQRGKGLPPIIVLQADQVVYYIKYGKSNYYYLKYPAYLGVFLLLFLIFWGLQKAQNKLAQSRFETEKRLLHQQLAISKNQLEPHFMLNTLNNIGYMFANENQEKAQFYFGKFASLIRRGLTYADKTETSLKEELEFIRDYLVLQERRYSELSFSIENEDGIDLDKVHIPHSLIYTFVENALKHGLFNKLGSKHLDVQVTTHVKDKIQVVIRDNGIGRKRSTELQTMGTGKGLHIVTTIVEGYNKLYNRSVSYDITDLVNEEGIGVGTEVRVRI